MASDRFTKIGWGSIKKGDESKGAPYFGDCKITIDGVEREIRIGAWVKPGKDGSKYFSLSFSVENDAPQSKPAAKQSQAYDEEIPF